MKSKRSLMTVLVGLAMLATPISAAAYDNHNYAHNDSHAARVSRSSNATARSFAAARNVRSADVTGREFRNNAAAVAPNGGWRADRAWADANAYRNYGRNYGWNYGRNYGNPGYYQAPAYAAAPPYYGAPGYAGAGACRQAHSIVSNYYRDRNTGHPAAANDLLRQNQWAFRSGCGGVAPAAGGLFGGLGGVPAYNNYGGYNGGYGQPYGSTSTLAPLIQQFVR